MPHLKLFWSGNALQCLRCIFRFLAVECENGDAAKAVLKAIRSQIKTLRKHPQAGRPADDLEPEHRELLIRFGASGYAVIYEVWPDFVFILSIRPQKEAGFQFSE